jgi:ELWxxDGT repeat protein
MLALGILATCLFAGSAAASPGDLIVNQVANISPGAGNSVPGNLANVNGTLFFTADDGTHGTELWKSDGSTATMVADINQTVAGASSSPTYLTNVNGTLFFVANDGIHGPELWMSTGTGATMVADIQPGLPSSGPSFLTNVNGTLFFAADDGTNGNELWTSNGGALGSGTAMVADINTVGVGTSSYPEELTNVNGTLFFGADDGTHGEELWKSNGGALGTGTVMVQDINTTTTGASSSPSRFANVSGTLFLQADDGIHGPEPWKSTGTGATMVADINQTPTIDQGSYPRDFTNVNGTAFFQATDGTHGDELFKSDPTYTSASTSIVADIDPGSGNSEPFSLTNVGGTLFFAASDGTHGVEPWKSNGGALGSGTVMVADINPGAPGSFPDPPSLINVNGTLFFGASDGTHGQELWKSNGGALGSGTAMVADINPAVGIGSLGDSFAGVGSTLFFSANDGTTGLELWRTAIEAAPPASQPPATTPGPTGQRAAAKKRCKKKFRKGPKRTKCIKKAKRLPV